MINCRYNSLTILSFNPLKTILSSPKTYQSRNIFLSKCSLRVSINIILVYLLELLASTIASSAVAVSTGLKVFTISNLALNIIL
jgi:hypothetical protein